MKKWLEQLGLVRWLCSSAYEKTVVQVLSPEFREDLFGVCETAKTRFPFLNRDYFGGYEEIKRDSRELWGVDVEEVELPEDLLGAYVPKGRDGQGVILVNKRRSPLFRLTTLAHELSHVPVCQYMQAKHGGADHEVRIRNRIALFSHALTDPEEILPDVLTTLGAYPRPDFERLFGRMRFGLWAVIKSCIHLPRHYPELLRGVCSGRDLLLNLALVIHFLKLRFFLYEHYDL